MHIRRFPGNTVIEVLIATLVIGSVITALAYLMSMNVKNNAGTELRKQANAYAQEGVDIVRVTRANSSWDDFKDNGTSDCSGTKSIGSVVLSRECSGAEEASGKYTLTVKVTWNGGTATDSTIEVKQIFYNQ